MLDEQGTHWLRTQADLEATHDHLARLAEEGRTFVLGLGRGDALRLNVATKLGFQGRRPNSETALRCGFFELTAKDVPGRAVALARSGGVHGRVTLLVQDRGLGRTRSFAPCVDESGMGRHGTFVVLDVDVDATVRRCAGESTARP
ncbi:MAG: hypothetical protein U0169_26595 [Polyangiaceae bacterium]